MKSTAKKITINLTIMLLTVMIVLGGVSLPGKMFDVKANAAIVMSTSEVTAKLTSLKSVFYGSDGSYKYWNGGKSQSSLMTAINNGLTDNASLGLTTKRCLGTFVTAEANKAKCQTCTSNYYQGWQCQGFAHFLEYALFRVNTNDENGGNGYTRTEGQYVTSFQPGDYIRCNGHSAVVWKVEGGNLYVAQCWGGDGPDYQEYGHDYGTSGCKIVWGGWNSSSAGTVTNMLDKLKSNGYVLRPTSYVSSDITVTPGTTTSNTKVTWKAVSGATKYDFRIYKLDSNGIETERVYKNANVPSTTLSQSMLISSVGTYHVAIQVFYDGKNPTWLVSPAFNISKGTDYTLTICYYSNYADKSFSNPLNAVGANKSVFVKKTVVKSGSPCSLEKYTTTGSSTYLARTYYTGTGYWNTDKEGNGYSVHESTKFATGQELALALGKDISKGNATVKLYPKWRGNTFSVNYYSNYADKSFKNPDHAVGADKNVLVCTGKSTYGLYSEYGVRDYSKQSDTYYLGRTGYTAKGCWNTKKGGSGYNVSEKATFSTAQKAAEAFGKSIANGDASVNVYAQWEPNKLTINYYSGYAERSFANPANAVGSDKNVIVRTVNCVNNAYSSYVVRDYTKESDTTYLSRSGYTATGNWNTEPDGSGLSINEEDSFSSVQSFAQAVGKDISSGDATVSVYPRWTPNKLTINYCSNYADKSFANPDHAVSPDENVVVRTVNCVNNAYSSYIVRDYTEESDNTYLGRTGYTATGYWNTEPDGSGFSINEDDSFSSVQSFAQAVGKDISSGDATVYLYPVWKSEIDAPETSVNKSRAETGETITFSYTPVTGVIISNYRIECKKADGTGVVSVNNNSGEYQFSIDEPGEYSITAIAVTPEGMESNPNNWQHFTVYTDYTVTLNPNCDTFETESSQVETDTGTVLPILIRSNYGLLNWNTRADGSGTSYRAGDSFKPAGDITLYASWQKEECEHTETYIAKENNIGATCTSDGSYDAVTYCTNCGEELGRVAETDEMLGHSVTHYTYNEDATVEDDGTETAVCDRCDATDTRVKLGTKLNSGFAVSIDTDKIARGQAVTWTVITPDDVAWLRFTSNYTTAAGATGNQIISCKYDKTNTGTTLISVSEENSSRIWSISMPLTYAGTSASANLIFGLEYKRDGFNIWESVNSTDAQGNTVPFTQEVLVVKSADMLTPATPSYEKYTIVSVTPDTDNGTFTVVTTDDVSKIRIAYTNAETGKVKSFAYQTTSTSIISCESENGLTTWVVKFKFNTPAENDTYSVQARGPAWGEAYNVIAGND